MAHHLPIRREVSQMRAKQLRQNLTPSEQLVWSILRDRRLGGLKFRRQVPVGPYIADFLCHKAGLIVELDGESHDYRVEDDAERTRYLELHRLSVFRVQNADVFSDLEAVAHAILRAAGVGAVAESVPQQQPASEQSTPSP